MLLLLQGLDGEATEDVVRELQESQSEAQDPEVQFAAAAALCVPLMQPVKTMTTVKQTPAASSHAKQDAAREPTAAVTAIAADNVQCHDQAANAGALGRAAVVAGSADSGAPSVEPGSDGTGLAVLIHVLSSPRATANPTHVYMLLRLLDAASKLKVCACAGDGCLHWEDLAPSTSWALTHCQQLPTRLQALTVGMLMCPAPLARNVEHFEHLCHAHV